MKKPIRATWQVKLIIIVFSAAVLFLMYRSFMGGVEEGRQMKLKDGREKGVQK